MSFYVRVPRINGRYDKATLASWLENRGMDDVEYHPGGWCDNTIHNVVPHLKFMREEDATAYVLAKGGKYSTEIPEDIPEVD
jgi:hypothetical protein